MKYHSLYDTPDNTFWMPLGSITILKPSYLPTLTVKYEDFNFENKTTLVSVQESVLADNLQDLLRRQNVALVHPSTTTACKYSLKAAHVSGIILFHPCHLSETNSSRSQCLAGVDFKRWCEVKKWECEHSPVFVPRACLHIKTRHDCILDYWMNYQKKNKQTFSSQTDGGHDSLSFTQTFFFFEPLKQKKRGRKKPLHALCFKRNVCEM